MKEDSYFVITYSEESPDVIEQVFRTDELFKIVDKAKEDGTKIAVYGANCLIDWS